MFSGFGDMSQYGMPGWGFSASSSSGRMQRFQQYFRCYPAVMMPGKERENVNYGGKIILPPSALNKLTMLNITYPMLFELKSDETGLTTHAGVLEFIAEEGRVYLPQWMMETLALSPGSLISVGSKDLPQGSFVRIQPQSTDFLDISDPKAVLENALRNFSTLTVDDIFQISYNNKIYSIKVLEIKPESESNSICVVETDLEVDFAAPVGYVEPSRPASTSSHSHAASRQHSAPPTGSMANAIGYADLAKQETTSHQSKKPPFVGSGQKLSGKPLKHQDQGSTSAAVTSQHNSSDSLTELPSVSAPALDLPFGQLFFGYAIIPLKDKSAEKERESNDSAGQEVHFQGTGNTLRQSRKRKDDSPPASTSPTSRARTYSDVIEID